MREFLSRLIVFCILVGLYACAPNEADSLGSSSDSQQTSEFLIVPPDEQIFILPQEPLPGEVGTEYTLFSDQPILEPESAWEEYMVSAGDVVFHDGYFHMFYNGTANLGSQREIGYALSLRWP